MLVPSLALLFTLTLRGQLGYEEDAGEAPVGPDPGASASRTGLLARVSLACLLLTLGFLTIADAGWAHAIGVAALFAASSPASARRCRWTSRRPAGMRCSARPGSPRGPDSARHQNEPDADRTCSRCRQAARAVGGPRKAPGAGTGGPRR